MVRKYLRPVVRAALRRLYRMGERYEEENLPVFATRPRNLTIKLPRRISGAAHIFIGDDVTFGPGSLLVALEHYPSATMRDVTRPRAVQSFSPRIVIGNRVTATGGLTLAAHKEIVIEDDVLFATNINITDGLHGFTHANEPYKYQPIFRIAPIRIGRGCWIGQNVQVLPGVSIGELSIIGANSVVTRSIPSRSIAFGAPARVVKQWDQERECWAAATDVRQERSNRVSS